MTGSLLDPDSADSYLRNWQDRVDRAAADTKAMSDRLADLRVTATDDNNLVTVTIDTTGVLHEIHFEERIQRVAPGAVSRAVLAALHTARRAAAARSREIVTETVGDDSPAGRAVAERMEQQLTGSDDHA
ncbi:hypothetical protein GCM10010172_12370 [Paractinoplanes ferrugineus]|uniref:YbaB/EbfC DNA-binding family protein n=1 Tax=Paractinoplanes ferrugineus TaxID=113564 RepID=A0A919IXV9_9ACTN|nr:YbaB/EbfC family nucleoid-associated protein [Actinoplanes ferrugineus]GIE09802.1 hypothetical protein Afe05nite_16420 [Actinoplanes ferrugineus]